MTSPCLLGASLTKTHIIVFVPRVLLSLFTKFYCMANYYVIYYKIGY